MMNSDEKYMKLALELAKKGSGKTKPNPMVGAVIVKDNKIISTGYHKHYRADHAEVDAIKKAAVSLKGAVIYSTLEPCTENSFHIPCYKAIIDAGIKEVVVGTRDPNPVVNGKGMELLKDAGINVRYGILEKEAREMNKEYNEGFEG